MRFTNPLPNTAISRISYIKNTRNFRRPTAAGLQKKFPNADSGIRLLNRSGIKTAVVTSKRLETLREGVEFLGLEGCFDAFVTPADTKKHKPDPEPVLFACEKLGVRPENALMVGDSVFDILSGRRAGAKTAGVNYSTTREALLKLSPDFMADDLLALAETVLSGRKAL